MTVQHGGLVRYDKKRHDGSIRHNSPIRHDTTVQYPPLDETAIISSHRFRLLAAYPSSNSEVDNSEQTLHLHTVQQTKTIQSAWTVSCLRRLATPAAPCGRLSALPIPFSCQQTLRDCELTNLRILPTTKSTFLNLLGHPLIHILVPGPRSWTAPQRSIGQMLQCTTHNTSRNSILIE